jgi:hypothetical protein
MRQMPLRSRRPSPVRSFAPDLGKAQPLARRLFRRAAIALTAFVAVTIAGRFLVG